MLTEPSEQATNRFNDQGKMLTKGHQDHLTKGSQSNRG
jgi:hypothetical protein